MQQSRPRRRNTSSLHLEALINPENAFDSLQQRIDTVDAEKAFAVLICGLAVSKLKQHVIADFMNRQPDRLGRLVLYDKFLNLLILAVTAIFLFDIFGIDLGPGVQSLFAAGGIGALIFSLASKDLAEQIVGGLVISAWDVFDEGDVVCLNESKIEGTVIRIGVVDTEIKGYDNIVIKIPNSQLFNQRVSNLSRVKQGQVRQTLRFKYSDLNELSKVLQDVKDEIRFRSCQSVITDGSKPLRADFNNYMEDHIQVVVNCHLDLPPGSDEYFDDRQEVLEAIARAVEKNNVEFAIPAIASYRPDMAKKAKS